MRWPIRNQILVPFALLMLGVVCGVSVLNAFLAARHTQEQIDTQLREVAHTLHDSTFPLTDAVLRQTRGLSGAEFILTNSRGEVQSASLVNAAIDAPATPTVGWDQLHLGPVVDVQGQRYFHAAIALRSRDDEGQSEQLHLLYPEAVWRQARWQAAYPPLVVGAAALAVVAVLALVIASRLSRPIDQLRSQVGRLAQGDFQPVPLPARNDELRDLVGSVNSLAEQLDQLRQAIKRSERLALLGQLAGGLAHHLRNNVTGARLAMQFHQRYCHDVDQESLVVALRQLELTEQQLKGFLAAGQPQAPQRADCDLGAIVDELVRLVEPACRHRKVQLEVDSDAGNLKLLADAEQLRQLLMNLVLNAIEAAGPDGWVRIELAGEAADRVRVRVCDSGAGPSADIAERLFEPFQTTKSEGVGLGLAVARQIATAHSGSLQIVSSPGSDGGPTCFELSLPRTLPVVDGLVERHVDEYGAALSPLPSREG
jgi:signal transduction histidine kinase